MPLACGSDGDGNQNDEQTLRDALRGFGQFTVVRLDTAALARAVQAGQPIKLPFGREAGGVVEREVRLTLRNLRSPDLTEFVLKDGNAGSGSSMPLPPPATYQGKVGDEGVAVFTVTDAAVEGSMLVAPEGWSFIEPLEPQLRLHNVEPARAGGCSRNTITSSTTPGMPFPTSCRTTTRTGHPWWWAPRSRLRLWSCPSSPTAMRRCCAPIPSTR